jgi:DNA-binding NarL/FixJ family response regulator
MLEQGRILIADNDERFLVTTRSVLEQEGYTCACAMNLSAVMALMEQHEHDLLIANIELPGERQSEWSTMLQSGMKNCSIIIVTGRPSLESALQAIQLQVGAYLVKPFEVQLLLAEVRRIIPRARVARVAKRIQKQWQDRYQDLQEVSAEMCSVALPPGPSIELLLTVVIDDLSHCFASLRELHALSESQTRRMSAAVTATYTNGDMKRNVQLADSSSTQFSMPRKRDEDRQEDFLPSDLLAQLHLLSKREREVLRLLLENQRPKTIAQSLFISLHTVRNHLRSIFEKFAVHSQMELLRLLGRYSPYMNLSETI